MTGTPQPLVDAMAIVNPSGTPTQYFIRWAQQRQIDIQGSIDAAQALTIVQQFLADHPLHAGSGIGLAPSGDIGDDITISAKVQEILDQISTARGTVLYRGAAGWAGLAPGTTNDLLATKGAGADPVWAHTAVTPGTYGDSTHTPQITVDQQGRVTAASNVAISSSGGGSSPFPALISPNNALFSWVNQGTATLTVNANGGITLFKPKGSTLSYSLRTMAAPVGAYRLIAGMHATIGLGISFQSCGLILRESSSGKFITFTFDNEGSFNGMLVQWYNSPTSFNATKKSQSFAINGALWYFKIQNDGTNHIFSWSLDGYNFITLYSEAKGAFIVPDQIGFFADERTNTYDMNMTVFHWDPV